MDTHGRPVAGARITTDYRVWGRACSYGRDELRAEVEGPETVTARDGTFLLEVGHGEIIDLCIRPQELGETMCVWRRPGDHLRIVVTDGADLTVTVRDGKGALLPDVRVFVLVRTPFGTDVHWHSGMTNAEGQYIYPNLSAGEITVYAKKDDWMTTDPVVAIPPSGSVSAEVILYEGAWGAGRKWRPRSAAGRVLASDGSPIERARVVIGPDAGWTDADGRFRLDLAVPVRNTTLLAIWAPGYGCAVEKFLGWEGVREFRLPKGFSISGRMTDRRGTPQAEVVVELFPANGRPGRELALTDAKGTYRFADVAPGRHMVRVRPGSRVMSTFIEVPADADVSGVSIDFTE